MACDSEALISAVIEWNHRDNEFVFNSYNVEVIRNQLGIGAFKKEWIVILID